MTANPDSALRQALVVVEKALRGDPDMPASIGPLSWLRSMIDDCKVRGPDDDDDDPSAWWEIVAEVEEFWRSAREAHALITEALKEK